jgi:hypothetical protein
MHMEIETLAASPTCRAHIFTVGRSLRLAYPEAEVAGGIRSSDKGRARLTPPWVVLVNAAATAIRVN